MFTAVMQGLFRIAAGASKLKKLKAALDCSASHLDEFYSDPHAVAGRLIPRGLGPPSPAGPPQGERAAEIGCASLGSWVFLN